MGTLGLEYLAGEFLLDSGSLERTNSRLCDAQVGGEGRRAREEFRRRAQLRKTMVVRREARRAMEFLRRRRL